MAVTAKLTAVTTQVALLQSMITAISPLKNASFQAIAPVILQAQATVAAIDAAIMETDSTIATQGATGFAGVVAGGFAPTMATGLQAQLANLNNAVILQVLRGAVGRALFNLTQAL